jgi:ferric-dicitrate binding protein FerR (iron transport regulator)
MNADSQLEFPEHFSGARRTVRLTGEAYFEVAKDRKHPFVVESPYFTTTVLGTTFNVRAYSPSDASVALVEGRVSVKPNAGGRALVMNPGQLASMKAGQKGLSLTTVDTYSYTQRKDGFFYFPDDTMREIMVELGRWYNKTVVFEEAGDMDMRLHFVAERSQSLPQIINSLSEMDGVDIVLGSNEIVVK